MAGGRGNFLQEDIVSHLWLLGRQQCVRDLKEGGLWLTSKFHLFQLHLQQIINKRPFWECWSGLRKRAQIKLWWPIVHWERCLILILLSLLSLPASLALSLSLPPPPSHPLSALPLPFPAPSSLWAFRLWVPCVWNPLSLFRRPHPCLLANFLLLCHCSVKLSYFCFPHPVSPSSPTKLSSKLLLSAWIILQGGSY